MKRLNSIPAVTGRNAGVFHFAIVLVIVYLGASGCAFSGNETRDDGESETQEATISEEANCLALSMYWEAKAEGESGMRAVGHVVLNRFEHAEFPDDVCEVIYDGGEKPPCQFSWYCDGQSDQPQERENWADSKRIAQQLLRGELADTTGGALFFHAKRIDVPWRVERERTVVVGNHIFYK